MADFEIKVAKDNVDEVLQDLEKKVQNALKACGATAEGYAKGECPVASGRLKNSITYATATYKSPATPVSNSQRGDSVKKGTPGKNKVYIGTNVEYAAKIEYRDMAHRTGKAHFLRDSIAKHQSDYRDIIKAALNA